MNSPNPQAINVRLVAIVDLRGAQPSYSAAIQQSQQTVLILEDARARDRLVTSG